MTDFELFNVHLRADFETGLLYWKQTGHGRQMFRPVGSASDQGYVRLFFNKKRYLVHRVIWLLAYGEWPKNEIDHINRLKNDNRLCNLRDVTAIQNCEANKASTTVIPGVRYRRGYYEITIGHKYLGSAKDFNTAKTMRQAAEQLRGE